MVAKKQVPAPRQVVNRVRNNGRLAAGERVYKKQRAFHDAMTIGTVNKLTAEFLIAFTLAVVALFFFKSDSSEIDETQFVMRATGVCAIFFVLAIAANSERMAKPAVIFGALIDLAMLLNITATHVKNKNSSSTTSTQSNAPVQT